MTTMKNGLHYHTENGWDGYVSDEAWQEEFRDLDAWLKVHPGTTIVAYPSREVRRVETPMGVVYLKYIRALTDAGLTGHEWLSWAKWVFRPSRALATWRISQKLLAEGFACPVPVLAVRRRQHGYPNDLFVSLEIPRPNLWDEPGDSPDELIRILAAETARFHEAGFAHGDFILRNLCLNPSTRHLVFLDNDRTWRPMPGLRGHYQKRNLAQMTYSLLRRFKDSRIPLDFLNEYQRLTGKISSTAVASILRGAEKRLANRNHREQAP